MKTLQKYLVLVLLFSSFLGVCKGLGELNKDEEEVVKGQEADVPDDVHNTISDFANSTRNRFHTLLYNLSEYIPVSVKYADEVGRKCNIIENNKDYYGVPALIIAAVLFIVGVLFCFIGYRLLKINLFLIGFLIGGGLTYFTMLAFMNDLDASWKIYVTVIVTVIVGVVIGMLTICIYYIGMFLAGGSVGFLATWFLLSAIDIEYFQTHIWIPFLIAIFIGIVCGVITLIFQKWLVIFGTSIIGAFLICWSIDYYLELGLMIYYLFLFAENRSDIKPCWYSWTIAGLFLLVAVAGFILQGAVTGRKYDHKKDFKDKGCFCGLCKKCKKEKKKGDYMPLKRMD